MRFKIEEQITKELFERPAGSLAVLTIAWKRISPNSWMYFALPQAVREPPATVADLTLDKAMLQAGALKRT